MPRLVKILIVLWSIVMIASALTHTVPKNLLLCMTSPEKCDFFSYTKRAKFGSSLTRLCDKNKRTPFLTEALYDLCSLPAPYKNSL